MNRDALPAASWPTPSASARAGPPAGSEPGPRPGPPPEAPPWASPSASPRRPVDTGALADVRYSADWLARNQEMFTRQLHHDMTRLVRGPGLPQNFDLATFCRRMVRTLLWAALTDHPPHVVVDTLRQVGAQNWSEGFPGDEYASVAHALVQTVHYLTSSDWSTSTGSAWVSFFMWMRNHLLEGAREAAAQEAAAQQAAARDAAARRAAAEREAARVAALSRGSPGSPGQVVSDVNIERVAAILDDDDDDDGGYSQIMISMTRRNSPKSPPRNQE